jgi:hypothetical protein
MRDAMDCVSTLLAIRLVLVVASRKHDAEGTRDAMIKASKHSDAHA